MSDKDIERGVDPLLGLKDIKQYDEPNFIVNGKLYLVRCYRKDCDPGRGKFFGRGRENYGPNVATGSCAWCGWKPDPEIVQYIAERQSKLDMVLTLDDIKRKYPAQYAAAVRSVGSQYTPHDQEDDGEID